MTLSPGSVVSPDPHGRWVRKLTPSPDASIRSGTHGESHAEHVNGTSSSGADTAILAGKRVEVENMSALKPGSVTLAFKVFDANGGELKAEDLKIAHDKRVHLLLVRDDMTQFQHLHPEYLNARWTVTTVIPEQGDYQMYLDIAPRNEGASVLRVPLRIGGPTRVKDFPAPGASPSAIDGEIKVGLEMNDPMVMSGPINLAFALTKAGQPVQNIQPYLGAFGHVVLLRHNAPEEFLHVHPVTEQKPTDGRVVFQASFPKTGRYTLYAQFNVDGSIKTFPITIDVEKGTHTQGMDHGTH